jgi:hypothetical protein
MDKGGAGKAMNTPTIETDIAILKNVQLTQTELLAGIAANQKETVAALETLRLSQWPPFLYILTVAGIGATLMTAALGGMRYVTSWQIADATRVLEYRVKLIETGIVWEPRFVPGAAPKEGVRP